MTNEVDLVIERILIRLHSVVLSGSDTEPLPSLVGDFWTLPIQETHFHTIAATCILVHIMSNSCAI